MNPFSSENCFISPRIRTLDPWITRRTLYRWAIWFADDWPWLKVAYISTYKIRCLQINACARNCHERTNSDNFRTKCCVKIVATLATTDVFLMKIWQKWHTWRVGSISVLIFSFKNESKFFDFNLLLLEIKEACCVNKMTIHSFVCDDLLWRNREQVGATSYSCVGIHSACYFYPMQSFRAIISRSRGTPFQ